MRIKFKKFLSVVLTAVMLSVLCPQAFATESQQDCEGNNENHIIFSEVSQLAPGEGIQYEVETPDGRAVVGINRMPEYARAGGETWRVWYKGLNADVEFYMTVSNNKVTSVYDYSISLYGSSYEDAKLSMTTTYGKLTFTHKSALGLSSSTCWLKGTVTGEDDQIKVTWQM